MTNWSSSRIAITLPDFNEEDTQAQRQTRWERFRDLKNHCDKEDDFNPFQILHPRPEEEENWHNWNCENWGTKWDMSNLSIESAGDRTIIIEGDTASCPPTKLLDYLMEELEFEVEAHHFSWENMFWGETRGGGHEFHRLHCIHIQQEDPEDEMALMIREHSDIDLNSFVLFGETGRRFVYYGDVLDTDWIYDRVECEAETALEHYEDWNEEHGNGEVGKVILSLKNGLLELLEEELQTERIDEGEYLRICNKLKNISIKDVKSMYNRLKDSQANMTHYYKKDSVEPQLVNIYC